jgi:hypothetical protein
MRLNILFIIFIFCAQIAIAQNGGYYKNWITNTGTMATFTANDTPNLAQVGGVLPFNIRFNTYTLNGIGEYPNSIISSPKTGRFLFYIYQTGIIFDSTFMPMPNSYIPNSNIYFSLGAINTTNPSLGYYNSHTSTSILSVPVSTNDNQFLLFTLRPTLISFTGYNTSPYNLYYSLIDMSLNNGKGDVVASQKNVLLKTGLWGGPLNAVRNPQNNHFWLLCHDTTSTYFAFDIDANGQINTTPVSSTIGNHLPQNIYSITPGVLKSNILGTMLALGFSNGVDTLSVSPISWRFKHFTLELCNFNKSTGQLNLFKNFQYASVLSYLEFSPNGNYLYAFDTNQLIQLNILNNVKTPIRTYPTTATSSLNSSTVSSVPIAGNWIQNSEYNPRNLMQLAENGKIYFTDTTFYPYNINNSNSNVYYLGNNKIFNQKCIPYPDLPYPACGFKDSIYFALSTDTNAALYHTTPLYNDCFDHLMRFPNIINSLLFSPTIVRPWATQISYTTATLNSQSWVANTTNFPITQRGFCYGLSPQPSGNSTPVAPGTGPFSAPIAGLQPNTTYYIRAYATNSLGTFYSADSTFKTLKPNTAPIMSSIANTNFCTADSIAFVVVDSETSPVHMQYSISSSNTALLPLSGLSISGVDTQKQFHFIPTAGQSGTSLITIQAIDSNGLQSSISFTLSVGTLPTLSTQAQGPTTFCTGDSVRLQVNAPSSYSYQWYKNGTIIAGALQASYKATQSGTYTCELHMGNCVGNTTAQQVQVVPAPIASITTPNTTVICNGQGALLQATTGTGYTYQWTMNGFDIAGATNPTYTATIGSYYTVKVSNGYCARTSSPITITVNTAPVAIIHWNGTQLFSPISFYSYQWYLNGVLIPGATGQYYTPTQTGLYYVMVGNENGCKSLSPNYNLLTLSINNLSTPSLPIYPNPTSGMLQVDNFKEGTLYVYNAMGQLIIQQAEPIIDLSKQANGIYHIRAYNQAQELIGIGRVVKE